MRTTLITVRLRLSTPGGVTAPESATVEAGKGRDRHVLPLRRDPNGQLQVPGSTVAGNLRWHCQRYPELAGLFGNASGDDPVASRVQVLGCVLLSQPAVISRTRTAMSRVRAAAKGNTLHTVEQLPAGTEIDIVLRWNDPTASQLEILDRALREWAPMIGRGSSTGSGRCAVTGLGRADYDLGTVDGLWSWLDLVNDAPRAYPQPAGIDTAESGRAFRAVRFAIVDGLHIGTGQSRKVGEFDVAEVVRLDGVCVVPGKSLKGVLRSRAEYICRACGVTVCSGVERSTCPVDRPCPTCRLFGRPAAKEGTGSRRGVIAVLDARIEDEVVEQRRHVALDRFTGGGQDKLLYTHDVVVAGAFTVRLEKLVDEVEEIDAALINAVLADLHDGLVGIGARTTAGFGTVRIVDPEWTRPDLSGLAGLLRGTVAA